MGVCFSGNGKEDGGGGGGGGGTDAKAKRTRPAPRAETAILFFPDVALPCHAHFHTLFPQTKAAGCRRGASCKYAHERTGLVVLLQTLYSARRTLDVCVYTFTCNELCNVLLAIHRRGVKVRVIVCGSTVHAKGSDIMQIKEAHIPVRCIKSEQSYHGGSLIHPLMHHKFVVADKNVPGSEILITGSLNWTRNAILNNNENLLIVRGAPDACAAYAAEFERLWIRGTQPA